MRNFKNTLRGIILLSVRNWNNRLDYLQSNKIHYPYYAYLEDTANCFSISAFLQHKDPDNKDSYTYKKISSALSNIWIGIGCEKPALIKRIPLCRKILGYKVTSEGRKFDSEELYAIVSNNFSEKIKNAKPIGLIKKESTKTDFTCGDCKYYEEEGGNCPYLGEDLEENEEICEEFLVKTKITKTAFRKFLDNSEEVNTKFIDVLSSIEKGTMIEKVFSVASVALNGKWFSSRDLFKHFKDDTNRSSIHYALRVLTEKEFLLRDSSKGSRSTKWKSLYPSNVGQQEEKINEDRVIPNIGGLVYELFPYALNGKGPLTVKMLEKIVNLIFTNANLSPAFEDEKLIKKNERLVENINNLKVENSKLSSRLSKDEIKLQSLKDSIAGL